MLSEAYGRLLVYDSITAKSADDTWVVVHYCVDMVDQVVCIMVVPNFVAEGIVHFVGCCVAHTVV